jgi:hypothetical protein
MFERLEDSAFSQWVVGSDSLLSYPTILTLHTVGLALVVGAALVVDLRSLGVGSGIPLATIRQAFRIFWVGFALNLVSGIILFAAAATSKGVQPVFYVKLALIAAALVVTSWLRHTTFAPALAPAVAPAAGAAPKPPPLTRPLALASLVLWGAAIVAGRLMAYL